MTGRQTGNAGRACPERVDQIVELSLEGGPGDPGLSRHLAECHDCAEYLSWLRPASDLLAEAVPARQAPRPLKRRVMAEIRADAKNRQRAGRERTGLLTRPRLLVAGALATAAIATVTSVAILGGNESGSQPTIAPVVAKLADTPIDGRLVKHGDSGVLELGGLPRLESNRVYQAWIRHDEQLVPSTVFVTNRTRSAEASIPKGLDGADEVLITAEPPGGSASPSGDPLVGVPLS